MDRSLPPGAVPFRLGSLGLGIRQSSRRCLARLWIFAHGVSRLYSRQCEGFQNTSPRPWRRQWRRCCRCPRGQCQCRSVRRCITIHRIAHLHQHQVLCLHADDQASHSLNNLHLIAGDQRRGFCRRHAGGRRWTPAHIVAKRLSKRLS